jgi:serine/threonine protein kinase
MVGKGAYTRQAEARVGRVLKATWRLRRLISVGGMAAVYEAEHDNGKRVAIKVLHADLSRDDEHRKRFLRESYATNAVEHPGVVKVEDGEVDENGCVFLVMELLEGEPLSAVAKAAGGRLSASEVVPLMCDVLEVLEAAHQKGLVHRDIKPENLFLTSDGSIKVLDFGIARLRELGAGTTSRTAAGTLMGTPAYMAPEQARGRWDMVTHQTDLWSVGATMFTLISGESVHRADTGNEQLGLAMTRPARSLASIAPDLPAQLIVAVDRALEYDPIDRWASAAEMRAALGASTTRDSQGGLSRQARPGRDLSDDLAFPIGASAFKYPLRTPSRQPRAIRPRWIFSGALLLTVAVVAMAGIWRSEHASAHLGEVSNPAEPTRSVPGPAISPVQPTNTRIADVSSDNPPQTEQQRAQRIEPAPSPMKKRALPRGTLNADRRTAVSKPLNVAPVMSDVSSAPTPAGPEPTASPALDPLDRRH